jgi:hypothetical protein
MRRDVERHVRIGLDHNDGENRIVIFIKAGKNISDELIIVEGSSCCSEVVGILAHLGVVLAHLGVVVCHREVQFLCCREGNPHIDGMSMGLQHVEIGELAPCVEPKMCNARHASKSHE